MAKVPFSLITTKNRMYSFIVSHYSIVHIVLGELCHNNNIIWVWGDTIAGLISECSPLLW